jgi:polysaccharide biosynthesis protein PslJ
MLALAGGCALVVGVLAAATSPLVPAAGLLAGLVLGLILWRPVFGVLLLVAVTATLPFGVIPLPIAGAQLTFVDAVLIATFLAILGRLVFGGWRLPVGTPGLALVAFVLVAITALFVGGGTAPVSPEQLRRVGKLLASLLFFLAARAVLTTPSRLVRLSQALMLAGAVQGAIGAGLMALSPATQLALLSRLQIIGYPTADVLRYVPGPNDTYTTQLRAIGTSVDPNVFGGTLMLALALIVVEWAAPRRVFPRWTLVVLALPTAAGLLLSLSRASWLGLAMGLLLIGAVRYRRILVIGALVGVALLASQVGQDVVVRFVSGFSTADRATAFRVGEYANALTLLQRYPLLGIGFGSSPDIDVTAGVSSVYLLVAEQTGVLGLGMYLIALCSTWWTGISGLRHARAVAGSGADRTSPGAGAERSQLQGLQSAFVAALSGALVAGLLDHYFANQAFPHAVALFWLYAAAVVTLRQLTREPEAG